MIGPNQTVTESYATACKVQDKSLEIMKEIIQKYKFGTTIDCSSIVSVTQYSLRSCLLPISPLCLSREEGMIHLFVGSHLKKPESGLFPDWIENNTNDLCRFDWPKCRHPLVAVN